MTSDPHGILLKLPIANKVMSLALVKKLKIEMDGISYDKTNLA